MSLKGVFSMKKISSIIAAALLLSAVPTNAYADTEITPEKFAACDVNSDGYVDTYDVFYIAAVSQPQYSAAVGGLENYGFTAEIENNVLEYADFDKNGEVSRNECLAVYNYMKANTECRIEFNTITDIRDVVKTMSSTVQAGDVDADGIVNAVDASNVLKYYALTSTGAPFDTAVMLAARHKGDMNGDKMVDSVDASLILKQYAANSVEK